MCPSGCGQLVATDSTRIDVAVIVNISKAWVVPISCHTCHRKTTPEWR